MSRVLRTFLFVAALCALCFMPLVASAHEHRVVGQYEFVVGFLHEPAFEGEQNGLWVKITDKATGQPVEKLADTLKAQIIFGDQQRELALEPAFGQKGVYTADFYPTAAGDYTFHFFGTIAGAPVNEKFTSSPSGFDSVKSATELQFPVKVPAATQLSAQLADTQSQLAAAQSTAHTALLLGGGGLGLGFLALIGVLVALRGRRGGSPARNASQARA